MSLTNEKLHRVLKFHVNKLASTVTCAIAKKPQERKQSKCSKLKSIFHNYANEEF